MTKKQIVIGSVVALVLVAGGAGVTAHHHAKVEADKIAQEAKKTHDKLINDAEEATQKAETFKAEADVKTAQAAIKKLDEKDKAPFITRVETVDRHWALVHKAEQAVIKAEKAKTEASVKTAQTAIDQLKADMTKTKKSALQHRLDKVKQAMKATKAKAEQAQAQAQTQASVQSQNTPASNATGDTGTQSADANSAPAPTYNQVPAYSAPVAQAPSAPQAQPDPSYNAPAPSAPAGGTASAPAQSSTNTGNPAYNSGAGANAKTDYTAEEIGQAIENANKTHGNTGLVNEGW